MPGVYREVWTGAVNEEFTEATKDTFLEGITDLSRFATGNEESQIIHSVFWGVSPDVLIDYAPDAAIPAQSLDGVDKQLILTKYQTKRTPISDDELYALSFDKIKYVKSAHTSAIVATRLKQSIFNLAPAINTAKSPVIVTTGEATPDGTRKRMRWADILTLRERLMAAGIATEGCRLVLSTEHVNDLIAEDQSMFKTTVDRSKGMVMNQLGLDIREYWANPLYNPNTLTKASYGSVPSENLRTASVLFHTKMAIKAQGKTYMYYSEAKNDTEYQRNWINFRHYFKAQPIVADANIAAIVSAIPDVDD
jgi:hypothetical protein